MERSESAVGAGASSLSVLVEQLQRRGRYTFDRAEALAALGVSEAALKQAARLLAQRDVLFVPRRGFYVIVPTEYRDAGAPPPSWYVDALMRFHEQPYYVALLSAAALHGAAHHAPQELQVMTSAPLRPVAVGRTRIRFFVRHDVEDVPVLETKTATGTMRVSTAAATALDLVRYPRAAGAANVPALLAGLVPRLRTAPLVAVASRNEPRHVQRLGALLDRVGGKKLTRGLAQLVRRIDPPDVALRPDLPSADAHRDGRWRVLVNDAVEVDP